MDYWKAAGIFYGFPDCCSTWFEERLNGKVDPHLTHEQESVLDGAGFIPCPKCAKKVYEGETTLPELISERKAREPYPNDYKSGLKKYIAKLEKEGLID